MSQTLDEIQRRLKSIHALGEIVSAMRALAAMRNQEAQERIAGTRAYVDNLRIALTRGSDYLGRLQDYAPRTHRRRALLVFCAEFGFAGGFTRRIIESVAADPRDILWVVGRRGIYACVEQKLKVDWSAPMATQAGAILDTVQHIAGELHRHYSTEALGSLDVLFARREGLGFAIERRSLLPIELPPRGARATYPPVLNQPAEDLIGPLVEEYLFAEIVHAATESFYSENTARLMTMDAARHNIDEKLEVLATDERRVRQEETTTELLDVMTGVAAAS